MLVSEGLMELLGMEMNVYSFITAVTRVIVWGQARSRMENEAESSQVSLP